MRRPCFRNIAVFLVMFNLFHLSGVAQTRSPGSLDKEQVRKELEAVFAERNDAIKKDDKGKARAFLSPDFIFKIPGGKTLTAQEIEKLALRDTGRSDYQEEYVIEEMEVRNGSAIVKVRHKESYKQRFKNGEAGEITTSNKRWETWVKNSEGWRLRGRYLKLKLAPGDYQLRSEKEPALSITVETGRIYYF